MWIIRSMCIQFGTRELSDVAGEFTSECESKSNRSPPSETRDGFQPLARSPSSFGVVWGKRLLNGAPLTAETSPEPRA